MEAEHVVEARVRLELSAQRVAESGACLVDGCAPNIYAHRRERWRHAKRQEERLRLEVSDDCGEMRAQRRRVLGRRGRALFACEL